MPHPLAADREKLVAIRHALHAHPEIAREEAWTASYVADRLREEGIPFEANIGGHGIVATVKGQGEGPAVALRADMDALEITELSQLPHASKQPGKMHACGHDGHMTILLAAGMHLARTRNFAGTVHLVFQPAEERYGGAREMVAEGLLDRFPVQRFFGLHNWPGLPAGEVVVHDGPVMAGTSEFTATFKGEGAHGAMPHMAGDPILAGGHFMTGIQQAVARAVDPHESAVATVGSFQAGHAQNIIPQEARLTGTLRAYRTETLQLLRARVDSVAAAAAAIAGCRSEVTFDEFLCPPVVNTVAERDIMRQAARTTGLTLAPGDTRPSMAGDDFGDFLVHAPGAYAWIGNGPLQPDAGLHQPLYDFNDDIILPAAMLLARSAELALSGSE
ncbi:amidohydrolase [Aquamicrobium defluvii]|uniref:Amidohydrolase n=1 Tax=Aquamicrobium defluvii TaxID=69279 RepID=A0A011T1H7_9HYPH|nr:amidohydrolase [Aquamicrobium defluvii]EXL05419.1 amidohydrolase [Aquamicrobium defluvii]EZQ14259.1 amidohydrolase [Halopseudomonas bauzanensis]TDR35264.1 hippurate hydrolase/putative tabtoxin peptidase [Aquamicrobium defluvii]